LKIGLKLGPDRGVEDPIIRRKVASFLEEDLSLGDITTDSTVDSDLYAEAEVVCRESAIVSGVREAEEVFKTLGCTVENFVEEGGCVKPGESILKIKGSARSILKGERTALNILGRMSGVATLTRRLVEAVEKVNPLIRVAATRKTLPGFGFFDKKAVKAGGGDTHRFSLGDAVLIKDNHIRVVGSIRRAVEAARRSVSFTKKVEVEASSIREALEAAEAGADIVMLDNMTPDEVSETIRKLEEKGFRRRVFIEASGGIGEENVARYAEAGVDAVSSGAMTHSARSIDFTLNIVKVGGEEWRRLGLGL